jgi:hypothetical protein
VSKPELVVSVAALHLVMLRKIATGRDWIRETDLIEGTKVTDVKTIDKQLSKSAAGQEEPQKVSYEDNSPLRRSHDTFRTIVKAQISTLLGSNYIELIPRDNPIYSVSSRGRSNFYKITEKGRKYLANLQESLVSDGPQSRVALDRSIKTSNAGIS